MNQQDAALDVVGIGNAIVDVLAHVEEEFIGRLDLAKAAMTLIDEQRVHELYGAFPPSIERSGGSAANTLVGAGALGSRTAFIGKVRDDDFGEIFAHDIRAAGVAFDVQPADDVPPTGRCLIAVTPDAERTMSTFLGASVELGIDDVDMDTIAAAQVLYLEGYLWDPPSAKAAMRVAIGHAKDAGRRVSISLSDSFCVNRHQEEFQGLVEGPVDLLFANEEEAKALYDSATLDEAMDRIEGLCEVAVITRSAEGSVVLCDGERIVVPASPVEQKVDATGAGDMYAAGFLHAFTHGADPATCARVGSIAAAEVIGHIGARPECDLTELVGDLVG